jgi:hypothetical protein
MTITRALLSMFLLTSIACGGDDSDDSDSGNSTANNTTANNTTDTNNTTDNSGGQTTANNTTTTGSEQTCNSSHDCVNGSCVCTTPGLENMPCTDDMACEDECEICS